MKYIIYLLFCVMIISGCSDRQDSGLAAYLPGKSDLEGAKPAGKIQTFSEETLFDYMNGGADIYFEYQFEQLAVRQFNIKEATVTVEIYKMGSPEQSFGIYTIDRAGEHPPAIGRDATQRSGFLSFWQNAYYVRIFSDADIPQSDMATIGRKISQKLPQGGQRPDLLAVLPPDVAESDRVIYFYGKIALNNTSFLSHENVLSWGPGVEAVTYTVDPQSGTGQAFIVHYPDADKASAAFNKLTQSGIIKKGNLQAMIYDGQSRRGFAGAKHAGEYIVLALDLSNQESVFKILNQLPYTPK